MPETHKSFCRFCHVFCGVEVDVDRAANRVVAVRGDRENPVSQGYTCAKGRAEIERLYHPKRLTTARKRVGDGHRDVAPEQALDEIALRLRAVIDAHGPESVAVYVGDGGHRTSAAGPWFVRKWLDALGSPRLYTSFTIDSPSLAVAAHRFFGGPVPVALFDIENADVALFVATNPVVSHLMTMPQSNPWKRLQDAQRRGMKLLVVDPRRSEVAKRADVHLAVKPGEDATLLAAMIRVILERGLFDADYVGAYVSGVEALREAVEDFTLDYASRRCGVPAAKIEEAAGIFAAAGSGGAQSGTGLHMARHQNLTTQLVMTLNGLCGRYDRKGGIVRNPGVLQRPLPKDCGPIPKGLFAGPTSRIRGIRGINGVYGYREMPTNTLSDEILEPGPGVRALIVHGGNPALVLPDAEKTRRALESLDLLVVNDLFMSDTARHADYVMAVKHPFEREDVPKLMDGSYPMPFSQYAEALVDAPPGVVDEWEVFWGLATRLGLTLPIRGLDMQRTPTTFELLEALNAGSQVPLREIREHPGGLVHGEPGLAAGGVIPNMIGHDDRRMAAGHPEVVAELREVRAEPLTGDGGYAPGERFAYRMITYRMRHVYCTQGHDLPSLAKRHPFNPVLMNPEDAEREGLADGARVTVDSGFGRVEGVVQRDADLSPGVVALAFGWGSSGEQGSHVQHLIPDDVRFDPVTGLAQQSAVPVNVSALPAAPA
ncbi:MAG: molybdopterin-containing oxidoreductase family protein [Myxococcota bacterium]